jgi:hypothetical protein
MEAQQAKTKQVSSNNENPILTEMAADLENRNRQLKPNAEQEEIQYDRYAPRYGKSTSIPPLLDDTQIPEPISISSRITGWSDTITNYLKGSVKTRPLYENENPDERISNQNTVGNETTDNKFSTDIAMPLEGYKFHTKEAEMLDRMLRGIVTSMEICDQKLNLEIKKSDQLRVEWQKLIVDSDKLMDDYNKVTQPFWKKKWFTVSASMITLGFFLFQMYKYKAMPNFIGLLADLGEAMFKSSASKNATTDLNISIPKLNITETIKAVADTPLAPTTIIFGVGTCTTIFAAFKLARFIFRK